ncbi:MAG: phosphatase PAP2 family protein [Rhodothermales bacterium]|nr:phosphatase PAP2 family protein [Rhodothermales bacterium]
MPRLVSGFFVLLALAGSAPGQPARPGQSAPDVGRFLAWAWGDALVLPGALTGRHLAYGAAAGGTLALLTFADVPLMGEQDGLHHRETGIALDVANEFGNVLLVGPAAAGLFAATLLTDDDRLQDAAFTSLQSAVYTGIVTSALKGISGRARPYRLEGPFEFEPFSGYTAMPSGHTSLAFAIAVPWAVYYPGPLTYGLVVLAGGTAVARVARNVHWPSDVVAGAALGAFTGYALARRHLGHGAGAALDLGFHAETGRPTLRLTVAF